MAKLTFFPLGNADCCRIDLDGGQKLLFDFADVRVPSDIGDRRIDLPKTLRDDLNDSTRNHYEIVVITHLDKDHYAGFSEFFYLEHAKKYQSDDRVRIETLWVPAAVIVEEGPDEDEARVIQAEARHRLVQGEGIRVFSRPDALKDWLKEHGLTVQNRAHLITDAGQTIPGFSTNQEGVELFVHSPFADRLDDGTLVDRNRESIVLQATFACGASQTRVILSSDVDHKALSQIVAVTQGKGNEARLEWDVFKLPHHCSYLSLGPEKGTDKTEPMPEVKWLFEEQGQKGGIVVSSSWPIPSDDEVQPPHKQAASYYRDVVSGLAGEFVVTMEHPSVSKPDKLEISVCEDQGGATVRRRVASAATIATGRRAPRAG